MILSSESRYQPPKLSKTFSELLPETTTIALIFGSSSGERFWAAELRKDLAPFEDRVKFVWLDNLLLSEVREQVAALRPRAVALYVVFQVDAAGIPYNQEYAIREIHAASKVPLFGLFENQVGQGMVGGALISGAEQAVVAAGTASRVLRGEAPQEAAIFLGPTGTAVRLAGAPAVAYRGRPASARQRSAVSIALDVGGV